MRNLGRWRGALAVVVLVVLPGVVGLPAVAPGAASAVDSQAGSQADAQPYVRGSLSAGDPYWPQDGNGGIDVRHYSIRVSYDFARRRIAGRTTLRVRATRPLRSFNLDFLLPVRTIVVDGQRARVRRPTRHDIRIIPARPLASGHVANVVVTYAGRPDRFAYAGERNWLADSREVVTMNQPHMAPWWFPANDHPSDKATYDIRVTVPRSKEVISNGARVRRTVRGAVATTHWRIRQPMSSYLAFFAAGDFAIERGHSSGGIPVYNAVSMQIPAGDRRRAMRELRRSGSVVEWLQGRLGRYPFGSTGGVVTGLPVGFALENQTRPTYGVWIYREVVVHELAHQWFGDSVGLRRWRDIWLNEGFATFAEAWYDEAHGGPSTGQWLQAEYDDQCTTPTSSFWSLPIDDPGPERVFDGAVYDRGGMALAALRNRIGAATFTSLLRRWVAGHRHRYGTIEQFKALAEDVARVDLDGFFDSWLSGGPPPAATAANGLTRGCP